MNDDLLQALVTGLKNDDRERTLAVIHEQEIQDRNNAAVGQAPRNVDVGTRSRRQSAPTGVTVVPPPAAGEPTQ